MTEDSIENVEALLPRLDASEILIQQNRTVVAAEFVVEIWIADDEYLTAVCGGHFSNVLDDQFSLRGVIDTG